jgi:hypothetical protein
MTLGSLVRIGGAVAVCVTLAAVASAQTTTPPSPPPAAKTGTKPTAPKGALPASVAAAFKKAYPNAVIKNWAKETEKGKTQYEVESMDGTQRRDINYAPDGTVLIIEELIPTSALPAPVAAAVAKIYPKASITTAEKVTTKEGVTQYEVGLKGAKVTEALFTPDGKPVK